MKKLHIFYRHLCLCAFVYAWVYAWAALLLMTLLVPSLAAQNQQIRFVSGTFWFDLDLQIPPELNSIYGDTGASAPQRIQLLIDMAIRYMRTEASYVFNGMIYGYTVLYVPPDKTHHIPETFIVRPHKTALIPAEKLEIYHQAQVGRRYYTSLRSPVLPSQSRKITAWSSAQNKSLQGLGSAAASAATKDGRPHSPQLLLQLRQRAIEAAIKQALRSHLRKKLHNKPQQIEARLALTGVPELDFRGGNMLAKVRLHLGAVRIQNYLAP